MTFPVPGGSTFLRARSLPFSIVPPTGDTTGIADTARLQKAVNTGPVWLQPAVYYLTQLPITASGAKIYGAGMLGSSQVPAASGFFTQLRAGTSATGPNMITLANGVGAWRLEGLSVYGQDINSRKPYTGALISAADFAGTGQADCGAISSCDVSYSAGDGIYMGTNRDAARIDYVLSNNHTGAALNLQGFDCMVTRCALAYSGHGYIAAGEMARLSDCDVFQNTVGGLISANRVYVHNTSHDQQKQQGTIVNNGAVGVSLHGRWQSNSLSSTGTYPHADISASGALGVTFEPGTMFAAPGFGDTQLVNYDIFANGATYQDVSTYSTAGYSIAHMDTAP